MARKLEQPPSGLTGPLGAWLRKLYQQIEAQPNFSVVSFSVTDTPDSRVTGYVGDFAVNIGSGTTDNRLWMLGGTPASVRTDQGWVPVLGGGSGSGLPAHATSHQNGGVDELNVAGLSGVLADVQLAGAHAATHKSGGTDAIKLDELAAPTDVTTLNASTSAHGLTPKLPNAVTQYLDGTGAWSIPAAATARFPEHENSISTDYTLVAAKNAVMAGPISTATPSVVSIEVGATLVTV